MDIRISPSRLAGSVNIPASKSCAHRALICAALADGVSHISGVTFSKDIEATINAMTALGASFEADGDSITVRGVTDIPSYADIDCNESGSTLRFVMPIASVLGTDSVFHGRGRLPELMSEIKKRNYKFIIFMDDLSFEEDESEYKELKAMLEGALESKEENVLIYATSNRRHLIRETWKDRNDMEYAEDVHRSDTMEEKLSLASRFGVTIYYSKPDYKEYMNIVEALAKREGLKISEKELADEARKWSLRHGSTSGRTASQLVAWLKK